MCQHEERQTSDAVAKTSGKHGLHPMSCMHELTENNHLNNDCVYPDSMHVCIGICRATPDVVHASVGRKKNHFNNEYYVYPNTTHMCVRIWMGPS